MSLRTLRAFERAIRLSERPTYRRAASSMTPTPPTIWKQSSENAWHFSLRDCVRPTEKRITLTDLEGLTQKDAAEMLGVSVSGMKSRVQRGREQIRGMFEECCRISVDCRGRIVECEARALDQVPEDCREAAASWAARR